MPDISTQFLKGVLTMLLLQLLANEEDYGYSLVERLQTLGFADLAEGTVYPALTRCERTGWLESRLVASNAGPARKYYRTTAVGADELLRQRNEWASLVGRVDRVLDVGSSPGASSNTCDTAQANQRKGPA